MDLKGLRTDPEKERGGVWRTYPGTDVEVRIARTRTDEYQREARRVARQERARSGKFDEKSILDAMAPVVAKLVILDWKNITENGQTVPYTPEKATEILRDPQLADFRDWILGVASDADNYRDVAIEMASGN